MVEIGVMAVAADWNDLLIAAHRFLHIVRHLFWVKNTTSLANGATQVSHECSNIDQKPGQQSYVVLAMTAARNKLTSFSCVIYRKGGKKKTKQNNRTDRKINSRTSADEHPNSVGPVVAPSLVERT